MGEGDRIDYGKRLLAVGLVLGLIVWAAAPAKSPPPPSVKPVEDSRWTEAVVVARSLRDSMKNPRSFELVQALRMESGALCFTYRATNSFNAVVPGHAVYAGGKIHATGVDGFDGRWARHCGGRSGDVIRGLAYAL